jgi:hypothetical protein
MKDDHLKLGLGGIIGTEAITFDFASGEKLKPYICKILGRDFKYGMKREFINKSYTEAKKKFYENKTMTMISFKLERFIVYEYKRFPGATIGEIEEGYFVILSDCIKELEPEEVFHWCKTAREKEKSKTITRSLFEPNKKYAPDDIDF